MSKAYEYGSEVGAVSIGQGKETDLIIENEQGIEYLTLGDPCTIDDADGTYLSADIKRENQNPDEVESVVFAPGTRIRRYGTIALTTAAGSIVVAGVVKGIRVWHKRDLQ